MFPRNRLSLTRLLIALMILVLAGSVALVVPFIGHSPGSTPSKTSATGTVGPTSSGPAQISASHQIPFHRIMAGLLGGYSYPTDFTINDQATWSTVWAQTRASCFEYCDPVPTVDFSSRTVLAVFLGERGNIGYIFHIAKVEQIGETVVADVEVTVPGNGCFAGQMMTQPFDIVDIPRTGARVTFTTEASVVNCV